MTGQASLQTTKDSHEVKSSQDGNSVQVFYCQGTPSYEPCNSPLDSNQHDALKPDLQHSHPRGSSIPMLVLLSLPRMALNMAWAAQWAALGPYLGTMLPPFAVQLTQLIGPLSGILVAPTIGVLSDRSVNPWGRRRPFLLCGAITSAICWTLMGFTRKLGTSLGDTEDHAPWTAFFTILFYTWMDITVNLVQTPAYLIIADFAGDRQTLGAGIGQASSTLGSIIVAGYIQFFGAAHLTLHYFLGMLSVTMLVTVGIVCIFAKETPRSATMNDNETSIGARILDAFSSTFRGLKALPSVLIVYCIIMFCAMYGYTAYNGSKGQFFGIVVYDGDPINAGTCHESCSKAQRQFDRGVRMAGGLTDLCLNILGYVYAWILPLLVAKFGAKWVLTISSIPQSLLMVMAFTKVVEVDVAIVILTSITQTTVYALLVPVVVHVFGEQSDVGMYVGALNSANCFGQLLNFVVGAAIVGTPLGYKLPVFVGGVVSFFGLLISLFFFKIKMYSM